MSSTTAREQRNDKNRTNDAIIETDAQFVQGLKIFSSESDSVSGLAGGASKNSPGAPAGNYLAREGDSMIGPLALGPPIDFRIEVDVNNTINISPLNENAQYSSNVQLDSLQPNSAVLDIIAGAAFDGQILILRTFAPTVPYTISQGTIGNGGNIQTPDSNDITLGDLQMIALVFDESLIINANTGGTWRVLSAAGAGGTGKGTDISAAMNADQLLNLVVGNHIEFDNNVAPKGHDGGIVLQTGAGQADGIFELIEGKTYFMSAAINPLFVTGTNHIEFVWYDITNATELGLRVKIDDTGGINDQPKAEIIVTPATDITVELRIVAVTTPANLAGIASAFTFAHIFEFLNGTIVSSGGSGVANSWKTPARALQAVNVPSLAAMNVIVDGVTLVEDNRVLLTAQTTLSQNGLWQVGVVAAGLAPLTRPTDFDTDSEVVAETFVAIEEGTIYKNQLWHLISDNPLTINVSNQVWSQFAPGISGGPDMGGGEDGIDGAGQFVNDGRIGVAAQYLKIWEIISITGNVPEDGIAHMIYLPSTVNTKIGRIFLNGQSSSTKGGAYSDNYGTSWTTAASLTSNNGFGNSAYAPNLTTDGTLVTIQTIAGGTSPVNAMKVSTNRATSFSTITLDFSSLGQNFLDVIWSEDDGIFLALSGTFPTGSVYTSTDGSSWTRRTTPAPSIGSWTRIVYSPTLGKYFAKNNGSLAGANSEHIESSDGITWTGPTSNDCPIGTPQRQIIWSEGHQKFVAVGTVAGVGTVAVSDDFITWTSVNPPNCSALNDIVHAPDLSLFVVIGTNTASPASPKIFWASNDLINWVNYPVKNFRVNGVAGVSSARTNIVYAEEFGYFFGCNSGFGTGELFFRTAMKIG